MRQNEDRIKNIMFGLKELDSLQEPTKKILVELIESHINNTRLSTMEEVRELLIRKIKHRQKHFIGLKNSPKTKLSQRRSFSYIIQDIKVMKKIIENLEELKQRGNNG